MLQDLDAAVRVGGRVLGEHQARQVERQEPRAARADEVRDVDLFDLEAAARSVGFREVRFQYEPIAAALDYESTIDREELVLVAVPERQPVLVAADCYHIPQLRFPWSTTRNASIRRSCS